MKKTKLTYNLLISFFLVLNACKTIEVPIEKEIKTTKRPVLEFPIEATIIISDYKNDNKKADFTYKNRELIVKGRVSEQYKNQEGLVVVVLEGNNTSYGVSCIMYSNNQITRPLRVDEVLTIKGFCLGKEKHVIMGKCVLK